MNSSMQELFFNKMEKEREKGGGAAKRLAVIWGAVEPFGISLRYLAITRLVSNQVDGLQEPAADAPPCR
jgi:hypothetical protein